MKIAIPTQDAAQIASHFGRCKAFLIYDVEGEVVRSRELRPNVHGHHAHAVHSLGHPEGHGHGHHDHGGFLALLHDCSVVISGGMGPGAFNALQGAGLKVCLIRQALMPDEAVSQFLSGTLVVSEDGVCKAHSHA